jgi:hypothetical protein
MMNKSLDTLVALGRGTKPSKEMCVQRTILGLSLLLVFPLSAIAGPPGGGNGNLTQVCHTTGNGVSLLSVNANALPGHFGHGDYLPVNGSCDLRDFGDCPAPTETTTCEIDLLTGAATCTGANPTSVVSLASGVVLRLDMSDWTVVLADVDVENPSSWVMNLGNSPSNNGWNGDGSHFSNDSEMQMYNNTVTVYPNDFGGGTPVLSIPGAVDALGDLATAIVCDGYFSWESGTALADVTDNTIFQIDGNEIDPQAGGLNDQVLWFGINRTVGGAYRNGSGVNSVSLTFGR